MKKWREHWQIWLALLVGAQNMEIVVIPLFLKWGFGLEGWNLKITAAAWATAEMFFWFWFAGWLRDEFARKKLEQFKSTAREATSIGKAAYCELKEAGLLKRFDQLIRCKLIEPFNFEFHSKKKFFKFLKGAGYVSSVIMLALSGLVPVVWIIGFAFCRSMNWMAGFIAIVIGNIARNFLFTDLWDWVWQLF